MKTVILDATTLTSLMVCPRYYQYRFRELWIPKGGRSNSIECGSIVHAIIEQYYKSLILGKSRQNAISDGFTAGKEYLYPYHESNQFIVDKDHSGTENVPEDSDKRDIGWKFVFKTMEEYFDFYRNDTFTPIGTEEVRGALIYQDDDLRVLWKAKFDTIIDTSDGMMSMDHKTMKQRRDTLLMSNQFIGQCIILRARNVIVNKIGFQSSLQPHEKFVRSTVSYTADKMAEWSQETVPHFARMLLAYNEAGYYPMQFSGCETKFGFCDFYQTGYPPISGPCQNDRVVREEVLNIYYKKGKEWDIRNA